MVELTLQVSDSLATKIQSFGAWSATILELNCYGFKSVSVKSAKDELVEFLSENPSSQEVLNYSLSEESQNRIDDLLELNREGEIGNHEESELEEWRKLNHYIILLIATAAKRLKRKI